MTKRAKKSRVTIANYAKQSRLTVFNQTAKYRQDEQVTVNNLMQEAALHLEEAHNELRDIIKTMRSRLDALEAAN